MGSTFHDPIDHVRTTRPFAGEWLIDVLNWPGYLLMMLGLIATAGSLAAFGSAHTSVGMAVAVAGIIVWTAGLVEVLLEHRRVRGIAARWYAEHPDVPRQPPSS